MFRPNTDLAMNQDPVAPTAPGGQTIYCPRMLGNFPESSNEPLDSDSDYGGVSIVAAANNIVAGEKTDKKLKRDMKRNNKRLLLQKQNESDLRNLERFLGMRPGHFSERDYQDREHLDWEENNNLKGRMVQQIKCPAAININLPAPFPTKDNVVFVSLDVEWWEKDPNKITEIGFSILDTRELNGIAPGENGVNWHAKIQSRHLRVEEYKMLRNQQYTIDNASRFLFGRSEFVLLQNLPATVAAAFRPPFSKGDNFLEDRTLVLVGQNVAHDVRALQKIGYDITNLKTFHPVNGKMDTQELFKVITGDDQPKSLGVILDSFDIRAWNLHNAGNDAFYTLQAAIAMAVKYASQMRFKSGEE